MTQPIRIPVPFGDDQSRVNLYLFTAPEPVLIDAGYPSEEAWDLVQSALAEHKLTVADLARVIITHPHIDHYGLASRIAQAGRAEVWMADIGVEWLRDFPHQQQQRIDYYAQHFLPALNLPAESQQAVLAWMAETRDRWEPIPPERIVAFPLRSPLPLGGLPWQVFHTPGHDDQITVFYQPATRQLLSADALIIPTATPVVGAPPPGQMRAPGLPHLVQSLEFLASLAVETVYPGHGQPFGNHRAVITAQIARIRQRATEAEQAIADGATTVDALFHQLYKQRATMPALAGLWMTVGYVDLLVAEGRVAVDELDGVWQLRVRSGSVNQ